MQTEIATRHRAKLRRAEHCLAWSVRRPPVRTVKQLISFEGERNIQKARKRNPSRWAWCAIVLLLFTIPSHAQTIYVWTGNEGINRWNKKKNWLNDIAPVPGTNVWLTFTGNVDLQSSNDFAAGSDFGALIFEGAAGAATLTGSAIDLFGGIYNRDAGITPTIHLDGITLASPQVEVATLGDVIISSALTGSGTLVKSLGGTLFLAGDNAHGGGTRIQAGTVEITEQQNLGTGSVTLEGGTLRINPAASGTVTIGHDILVTSESSRSCPGHNCSHRHHRR